MSALEGYEKVENYLRSLDPAMIQYINTEYKNFAVYHRIEQQHDPVTAIMLCIATTGCYYEGEINAALKCLRQSVMLYLSGHKDVRFSPHHWTALCTVESMFGTV